MNTNLKNEKENEKINWDEYFESEENFTYDYKKIDNEDYIKVYAFGDWHTIKEEDIKNYLNVDEVTRQDIIDFMIKYYC